MTILTAIIAWLRSLFVTEADASGVSKDWGNNLPPWTSQFSVMTRTDAMDCLAESFINIVYMTTGFDASPRALAKLANTTRLGNSETAILNAVKKYGLIPYELWPTPDDFSWNDYYAPIPQAVLDQAIRVDAKIISASLAKSPLWTILRFPNGAAHGVAQINSVQYFDSEQGDPVKMLTYGNAVVTSQVSLSIKLMVQCKTVKFADGKTLGMMIDTPNGTQIIKATGEDQWRSWHKPESYGKPTVNADNSTNWEAELTLNF